jgi:hypothetical protein
LGCELRSKQGRFFVAQESFTLVWIFSVLKTGEDEHMIQGEEAAMGLYVGQQGLVIGTVIHGRRS